ncbi:MAG: formylglycine-generating enzyme family protein [Nitrospinae bacterium]|nr:formylglycine-generating enzyme family protein [Nitrospinota bacterium]MZH42631.1 formylglycine-generating enzyme family protein [Nitrospinota bacterium]MZH45504.1 formylglycine-generating enzyme family protein [Nitrospinota bacterium]
MPITLIESINFSGQPSKEKSVNRFSPSISVKGISETVFMQFFQSKSLFAVILFVLVFPGCVEKIPEGMILIPSGEFTIGSSEIDEENHALSLGLNKPWFADETPERRIDIPDFYIDRYEVTNQQYFIFCQATDHKPPRYWKGQKYPEGMDRMPVTQVSYFDASAYAKWAGKRLPNELEWEKAARGRAGFVYPWGDDFIPGIANLSLSPRTKTGQGLKPVGSFPKSASPYGVQDMIGNVWEWVWEYYQPYPDSEFKSPAYEKKHIVVRGMSYMGVGHFSKKDFLKVVSLKARASYREHLSPLARQADVGFRCAKDRPPFMERVFGVKSDSAKESKDI